jgi:hypothetical protein
MVSQHIESMPAGGNAVSIIAGAIFSASFDISFLFNLRSAGSCDRDWPNPVSSSIRDKPAFVTATIEELHRKLDWEEDCPYG